MKKEQLAAYFSLPINEAAQNLGICATVLKKLCRKEGIDRWPHRKFKSLDSLIEALMCIDADSKEESERLDMEVLELLRKRALLTKNPNLSYKSVVSKHIISSCQSRAEKAAEERRYNPRRMDGVNITQMMIDRVGDMDVKLLYPYVQESTTERKPQTTFQHSASRDLEMTRRSARIKGKRRTYYYEDNEDQAYDSEEDDDDFDQEPGTMEEEPEDADEDDNSGLWLGHPRSAPGSFTASRRSSSTNTIRKNSTSTDSICSDDGDDEVDYSSDSEHYFMMSKPVVNRHLMMEHKPHTPVIPGVITERDEEAISTLAAMKGLFSAFGSKSNENTAYDLSPRKRSRDFTSFKEMLESSQSTLNQSTDDGDLSSASYDTRSKRYRSISCTNPNGKCVSSVNPTPVPSLARPRSRSLVAVANLIDPITPESAPQMVGEVFTTEAVAPVFVATEAPILNWNEEVSTPPLKAKQMANNCKSQSPFQCDMDSAASVTAAGALDIPSTC